MTSYPTRAQTEIAAELITLSENRPLDQVLRSEFKRRKGLSRGDSAVISGLTQAYYRWVGWLQPSNPLISQITEASQLDRRFQEKPNSFSDAELIEKSVPSWVAQEMDCGAGFVRALQSKPLLWLRARPGDAAILAGRLGNAEEDEARWKDAVLYHGTEDLFRNEFFQNGDFEIQDLNSQAIGWLCAPKSGETWWDACAGEGGKTLHLSDLLRNQGLIWASETAEWRLEILRRRAARARVFNYRGVLWKDQTKPPTKTRFDGVLVDAPCTGSGTWQRNTQARWTTSHESVERLADLQLRLLCLAAGSVKPGGKLIYSVCTLLRQETAGVIAKFEKACSEFQRFETPNPWTAKPLTEHWFWPQETRGNGMFAAVWKRAPSAAAPAGS